MASRTRGSLARGVGEARAITGLGRPELVCRPSPQEWGSRCKRGRGEVSGTEKVTCKTVKIYNIDKAGKAERTVQLRMNTGS